MRVLLRYSDFMIQFPDYTQSLVNVTASLAAFFGITTPHPPLATLEQLLKNAARKNGRRYRNVVLFLFDGMGCSVLEHHLKTSSFLRKHFICPVFSVFPPTTTAAVTSVETGLTPLEHGRLGWTLYFPELDKNVNVFTNTLKDSKEQAAPFHAGNRFIPCNAFYKKQAGAQTDEANGGGTGFYTVSKFGTNKVNNSKEMFDEVFRLCTEEGGHYIYAYSEKPDSIMHVCGTGSIAAKACVCGINRSVQRFCRRLKQAPAGGDTLVLVTADHGHIPVRNAELTSYPQLEKMLVRRPSIEARAVNFFVKPEYLSDFPRVFGECFKTLFAADIDADLKPQHGKTFDTKDADFLLFSKREALGMELFGTGTAHPSVHTSLGDYLAVACSSLTLVDSPQSNHFKSHHAGLTAEEMCVPLIALC